MIRRVKAYMATHGLFTPSGTILCAVSGGPDSVALLRMMLAIERELSVQIAACHFEHGIRGEPSQKDMEFVQALCGKHNVPLYWERGQVPLLAKDSHIGIETAARLARREFYDRAMKETGATELALGHHMDDQAETVLMHMARGAKGAVGMQPRVGSMVRPMLCLRREELLAYLSDIGQDFCIDATNAVEDNPRNILRRQVMPPLMQVYPGAVSAIARAAEYMASDDGYLQDAARSWLCVDQNGQMDFDELPPEPVLRRALVCYALDRGAPIPDSVGLERLLWLARSHTGARVELGDVCFERTRRGIIACSKPPPMQDKALRIPGITPWGEGCFETVRGKFQGTAPNGMLVQTLDEDSLPPLTVRYRMPGDRLHPLGAPGGKKLKEILIDKGIPRGLRDGIPLLANGPTVYWMPGLPPSEQAKITEETKNFVTIIYHTNTNKGEVTHELYGNGDEK